MVVRTYDDLKTTFRKLRCTYVPILINREEFVGKETEILRDIS